LSIAELAYSGVKFCAFFKNSDVAIYRRTIRWIRRTKKKDAYDMARANLHWLSECGFDIVILQLRLPVGEQILAIASKKEMLTSYVVKFFVPFLQCLCFAS
jgi:hypothetical protein